MTGLTSALLLLSLMAVPAFGDTLYAANGGGGNSSTLYVLDAATGAVISSVGPIGFSVSGLAFDPATRVLYGSTGNVGSNKRSLVRIDTTTGAGTLIGPTGVDTPMADLAFGPSGILFGWSGFQGTRGLYTINVATGAATFVGPNTGRGTFVDGNALASDAAGHLFGGATNQNASPAVLFSVDPATAVSTFIANLTPLPGNPDASVSALAFNSAGMLFGSLQNFSGSVNQFVSFLVTIDTTTGAVTNRGRSVDRLDAIAFLSDLRAPAPTSSTWGLAILMSLLVLAGVAHVTTRFHKARNIAR